MHGWRRDLRHAFRRIRREPGFSSVLILTMAVAIGANAAIFGAVRPVVAPELPFPEASRIMRIWEQNTAEEGELSSASWQNARDWADAASSFESLAVYTLWEGNLLSDQAPMRIPFALVEPDFFRVLGVAPALGRALLPEEMEPDRGAVVLLSHGLWTQAFGQDPSVLGQAIHLSGQTLTVVGVMPASFTYPGAEVEAWKPFGMTPDEGGDRGAHWVTAIGRLAPEVSQDEAQLEMTTIGKNLEDEYPDTNTGLRPLLVPLPEVAVAEARQGVLLLWGAVALLLLVACSNLAAMLLARGEARVGEMGVRCALGAGRGALVRQLLLESLVTASLGGSIGLLLAIPGVAGIQSLLGSRLSYGLTIELDPAVVAYTFFATALAGIGFGILPALRASGASKSTAGRSRSSSGRRLSRWGTALIAGQTALAVVILVGAGLLGRTMVALQAVDSGFSPEGALTFRVAPPQEGIEREEAAIIFDEIQSRVTNLPGVTSVAAVNRLPMSGAWWGSSWTERARLGDPPLRAFARVVIPGYSTTLGLPLLEGRFLDSTDDASADPVAVVSARAAARYWPDGDAVGSTISINPENPVVPWVRVVGVVGDVEETGLGEGPAATVYTPFRQAVFGHFGDWGMDFILRTDGDPVALAPAAREALRDAVPSLPIFQISPLEDRLARGSERPRTLGLLMTLFAITALFLAAVGVYGTLSYRVAVRTPEIGVRLAIGARPWEMVGGVLGEGLLMATVGLMTGLVLAAGAARWIEAFLFGVAPVDPVTYIGIAVLLVGVVLFASGIPAWRAARVDPVEAIGRN
jgi:predicted permease